MYACVRQAVDLCAAAPVALQPAGNPGLLCVEAAALAAAVQQWRTTRAERWPALERLWLQHCA
jgi:hypothetical protein